VRDPLFLGNVDWSELMKSNELFIAMPTALAESILEDTYHLDKPVYRAVLDAVAQARKLRTIFLERQPRGQRHALVVNTLMRRTSEALADNVVRTWLLKKHVDLLTLFLDSLGISHDKGMVDEVPDSVEREVLERAVETVLAKFPQDVVAIYLHAFHEMNDPLWENLAKILETDTRLQFATEPARNPSPEEAPAS